MGSPDPAIKSMKHLILSCLLGLATVLPACAQDWALNGYDPVAYSSGRPMPGRSDIATMWKGRIWHFASEENRNRFEADPRAFAPAFDGLCPVSLTEGRRIEGDPRHFAIVGKKLYLLRSDDALRQFWQAPRQVLQTARQRYSVLRQRGP